MRVGLVIYGSLDLVSGGFLYDRLVVRELRARGVEVSVIALPWRRFGGALAQNLLPWPEAIVRAGVDVLVEDQLVHPAVFARHERLRTAGLPVVALVHNLTSPPGAPPSLRSGVERAYFATVDGVIAVCENTLAEVRAVGGKGPALVARPGRDHVEPAPPVPGSGALRMLFVGTVMPHKGVHRILEALAPLRGWTLDVVGSLTADAAYVAALRRTAPEQARFHGELHGTALWERYRHADLFVLPSDREAYSIACLEALGFGLPVLVTDRGGMREMIAGPEGATLPPDDIAAWTRMMRALMADRVRLAAMSGAARARHAQHGAWSETARAIEGFLSTF